MKHKIFCLMLLAALACKTNAQQFINKGSIEFEVTTNVKKTMGDQSYLADLKASMPTFKIAYYKFTFADNKSIYKFDHYDETKAKVPEFLREGEDENQWFNDFNTNTSSIQKTMWGTTLNLKDSIKKIPWKLSNERRVIAGFNCRKAVGKIMDSVYVFAFYTEEITVSGGPCTVNGLPGMILGLTIPRLYTSMIATKLMVNDVKESIIKPVIAKKYYTPMEVKAILDKRFESYNWDDEEEGKDWKNRTFWNLLL